MQCIGRARRTLPWAVRGAPGSRSWRRARVSGAVGVVVLVAGVASGVVGPSLAGAAGLQSSAFSPPGRSVGVGGLPCDRYGRRSIPATLSYWEEFRGAGEGENRWADRVPIAREDGREIVFAAGDAVYAASVQGVQLWRLVREDDAFYYGVYGGRSRYGLEGIVSFDVSRVDGALVYATCWSYQPDSSDPEIAGCLTPADLMDRASRDYCFKNPPHTRVRLAYPSGDVLFDIGDNLHELTVVRPDEGTATRLYLGNFPTWSPDGQRIAFVSTYWRTAESVGGGPLTYVERVIAFASTFWRMVKGAGDDPPSRVTRVDSVPAAGGDPQSRVQIMAVAAPTCAPSSCPRARTPTLRHGGRRTARAWPFW